MRRIPITPRIETIAKGYARKMENARTFSGNGPKERLLTLSNELKKASASIRILKQKNKNGQKAAYTRKKGSKMLELSEYVKAIYDHYDGLNALLPSEYQRGISRFVEPNLAGYDIGKISVKLPGKKLRTLAELIVEAMQYKKVQKDIMPEYIRQVGIKTCVYCNAQFATTASLQEIQYVKKGKYTVKTIDASCYELDHNIAKSKRPYLCTNFYNLQPSCSSCNRRKNDRELGFSLYYEIGDTETKPVHIALDHADIIRFRMTNNGKGIRPYICNEGSNVPPVLSDNTSPAGKMNHMLGVQGVYNEHEDIVEEILWKHKIYSEGFMTATINQIKSLGIDGFDMKRFILGGYYDKEEDFLKRPLSIMKNDVWEQLNTTP